MIKIDDAGYMISKINKIEYCKRLLFFACKIHNHESHRLDNIQVW
jgi:hypothetical protein